jgi:hypothetical protein
MSDIGVFEQYYPALQKIAKTFYQAYRLTGTVRFRFGVRPIADSDGNSVIEVYQKPLDLESANLVSSDENSKHMQFLESMVPAAILGYQFIVQLVPEGPQDLRLELVNMIEPVTVNK